MQRQASGKFSCAQYLREDLGKKPKIENCLAEVTNGNEPGALNGSLQGKLLAKHLDAEVERDK